jgi:hypothetical protein
MVKGPLADRLQYAILQIVTTYSDDSHQESWGAWRNDVTRRVPDLAKDADLKAAFKRLWKADYMRLSKAHDGQYHGLDYSGNEQDDDDFFFIGSFNATITDDGRSYWDGIRVEQSSPIGFV